MCDHELYILRTIRTDIFITQNVVNAISSIRIFVHLNSTVDCNENELGVVNDQEMLTNWI